MAPKLKSPIIKSCIRQTSSRRAFGATNGTKAIGQLIFMPDGSTLPVDTRVGRASKSVLPPGRLSKMCFGC